MILAKQHETQVVAPSRGQLSAPRFHHLCLCLLGVWSTGSFPLCPWRNLKKTPKAAKFWVKLPVCNAKFFAPEVDWFLWWNLMKFLHGSLQEFSWNPSKLLPSFFNIPKATRETPSSLTGTSSGRKMPFPARSTPRLRSGTAKNWKAEAQTRSVAAHRCPGKMLRTAQGALRELLPTYLHIGNLQVNKNWAKWGTLKHHTVLVKWQWQESEQGKQCTGPHCS